MSLAKLFVEVGADVRKFENGMQNVRSEIDRTSKQASNFAQTINTAIGVGLANATAKGVNSLSNFINYIKKTGEEFNSLKENSQLAFETMLGSTDKATEFLSKLQKFAESTPFELPGLIDASQKMLAFGFTAEKILPTLTAIGDAVSGLGGSPEKLQRVITAIGQIQAKGKVQAQEMLQLAEAGIPAWEMLAKAIGKTIPEAMKESENGAIDAATAINALINGMNQKFGGLMAKQSKSFTGLKSTFNDLLRDVAGKVTKPWFDNAKRGLETMIALMQTDKFKNFLSGTIKVSERLANTVAKIKGYFFSILGKGFNLIEGFFGNSKDPTKKIKQPIDAFRLLTKILGKYENKRFTWLSNFTPKEALTAIKGFITDLKYGGKNLDYWVKHTPRMLQPIQKLILSFDLLKQILFGFRERMPIEDRFKNIGKLSEFLLRTIWGIKAFTSAIIDAGFSTTETLEAITIFPKILQPLARSINKFGKQIFEYLTGEGLQKTLKKLGLILTGLGSILSKLVRPFKDALGSLFTQLSAMKSIGFADVFNVVLSSIAKAFSGFLTVIKDEFWPTIKGALVWVWDSLSSFITSINWGSAFNTVLGVFSALYDYVKSIDWTSLWNLIWLGLANINSFLKSTLLPSLGSFFDWLISWFTDTDKSTKLFNAITATWTFVIDWASYIWQGVSPYLSGFFGWLLSWFTDQNKRQQLYGAISTTWNFVVDWASSLWGFVSPYLSSFFSSLTSWFTHSSKRQSLYNGLVSTWTFVKDWAVYLWQWISPYLSSFWSYLTSWFTDPTKNAQLRSALLNGWNAVSTWGASLWVNLKPWLDTTDKNLETWVTTNKPEFTPWYQSIRDFLIPTQENWSSNFNKMSEAVKGLVSTLLIEIPKIGSAIGELYSTLFGSSPQTTWLDYVTYVIENVSYKIKLVVTQIRIVLDMINLVNEGWKRLFAGDLTGYADLSGKWDDLLNQFLGSFSMPSPQLPGYATGGITKGGLTLVGEKGPELIEVPRGSRVWDHGQSMGKLQQNQPATYKPAMQQSSQTITVILKNEGELQAGRKVIDDIAVALQRRLSMQGNRVVFA